MALRLTGPAPQGPPARKLAETEPPRRRAPRGLAPIRAPRGVKSLEQ